MQIFCDGGSARLEQHGKKRAVLSWGIKIIGDGIDVELMGSRLVNQEQSASHEVIALIEAVIWANAHNGNTLNTRFFTDSQELTLLCRPVVAERRYTLSKHLKTALQKVACFYSKPVLKLVEQYLIFAEINWVKGHSKCTYNCRADYLSTVARGIATGTSCAPLSFDDWLLKGTPKWNGTGNAARVVHRPFCSVQPAEAVV